MDRTNLMRRMFATNVIKPEIVTLEKSEGSM
jgi:hypothetical protein